MNKKTIKRDYCRPQMAVYNLKMSAPLLAGSITESSVNAEEMNNGSFGSREFEFDEEDF